MINGVVFIYFKIIKDDLSPALNKIKINLGSDKFAFSVFTYSKKAIIDTSERETPKWTWDLHNSITDSPSIFGRGGDFIAMDFGARGGDDPSKHTDPANYAWEKEREYHYFSTIFTEAKSEFLTMSKVSYGSLLNKYSYH